MQKFGTSFQGAQQLGNGLLKEDIQGLDSQMRFLERSREKYSATQQYKHAVEKYKEIASIRERKRKLQLETTQLQKLDVKSKKYQKKKKKTYKDQAQEPDLKQTKLFHGVTKQSTGDKNSNEGITEKSNVKDHSRDCTEKIRGNKKTLKYLRAYMFHPYLKCSV